MSEERTYTPFIYLATDIRQAASDMIEEIGALSALNHLETSDQAGCHKRLAMRDLSKAVKKAAKALRNYEALIAAKVEKATREQYEDAAEVL